MIAWSKNSFAASAREIPASVLGLAPEDVLFCAALSCCARQAAEASAISRQACEADLSKDAESLCSLSTAAQQHASAEHSAAWETRISLLPPSMPLVACKGSGNVSSGPVLLILI